MKGRKKTGRIFRSRTAPTTRLDDESCGSLAKLRFAEKRKMRRIHLNNGVSQHPLREFG